MNAVAGMGAGLDVKDRTAQKFRIVVRVASNNAATTVRSWDAVEKGSKQSFLASESSF